jgi:hypothetical protein
MFARINAVNGAIALVQNPAHTEMWQGVLLQLADTASQNGLITGRASRLLLDAKRMHPPEAARRFGFALSTANEPNHAAAWVDGFIRNSGLLLLHDESLWNVLDDWVTSLSADQFTTTLPLLRRTFSTFQTAERRQLGIRVAAGAKRGPVRIATQTAFDEERANKALPLVAQLLGLEPK